MEDTAQVGAAVGSNISWEAGLALIHYVEIVVVSCFRELMKMKGGGKPKNLIMADVMPVNNSHKIDFKPQNIINILCCQLGMRMNRLMNQNPWQMVNLWFVKSSRPSLMNRPQTEWSAPEIVGLVTRVGVGRHFNTSQVHFCIVSPQQCDGIRL